MRISPAETVTRRIPAWTTVSVGTGAVLIVLFITSRLVRRQARNQSQAWLFALIALVAVVFYEVYPQDDSPELLMVAEDPELLLRKAKSAMLAVASGDAEASAVDGTVTDELKIPRAADEGVSTGVDCTVSLAESKGMFCESNRIWAVRKHYFVHQLRQSEVTQVSHPLPWDSHKQPNGHGFWMYNWEPNFSCPQAERLGAVGGGGKWLCDIYKEEGDSDCLIYSIGSNNEFGWEMSMHEKLPECEIHVFDHTVTDPKPPSFVRYHAWGISSINTRGCKSMHATLHALGHQGRRINTLKVDIEGAEYEAIMPLLVNGSLDSVHQLLLEIHLAPKAPAKIHTFMWALAERGWVIFSKEANPLCLCNYEYSFLNLGWNGRDLISQASSIGALVGGSLLGIGGLRQRVWRVDPGDLSKEQSQGSIPNWLTSTVLQLKQQLVANQVAPLASNTNAMQTVHLLCLLMLQRRWNTSAKTTIGW